MSDMKKIKCTKCGKTKQSDRFHKDKNRKSGFAAWCKDCLSAHKRERLRSDPEYRARRNAIRNKCERDSRKTAMFIKMIALGMALKNSVNSVPSVAGKNLRFEI